MRPTRTAARCSSSACRSAASVFQQKLGEKLVGVWWLGNSWRRKEEVSDSTRSRLWANVWTSLWTATVSYCEVWRLMVREKTQFIQLAPVCVCVMIMTRAVLRRRISLLLFSLSLSLSAHTMKTLVDCLDRLPRRAACRADRLLPDTSVCDLLRFLEHSGGQGSKQQHEWISALADAAPAIGLLVELDSKANTNCNFSSVAYRSPSL